MSTLPKMTEADVPFTLETGPRTTGIFAEKRLDGSIASVAYWREGTMRTGIVFSDTAWWIQTNEYFTTDDEEADDDVATQRRDWLAAVAFPAVRHAADRTQTCAFCEKTNAEVAKLIMGPRGGICNECVALCNNILES